MFKCLVHYFWNVETAFHSQITHPTKKENFWINVAFEHCFNSLTAYSNNVLKNLQTHKHGSFGLYSALLFYYVGEVIWLTQYSFSIPVNYTGLTSCT